ncbi:hypothetical protein D3C81_1344870 [compost metagenome]
MALTTFCRSKPAMLPKPIYSGGVPAARKSRSAVPGCQSGCAGTFHAPVTSQSACQSRGRGTSCGEIAYSDGKSRHIVWRGATPNSLARAALVALRNIRHSTKLITAWLARLAQPGMRNGGSKAEGKSRVGEIGNMPAPITGLPSCSPTDSAT